MGPCCRSYILLVRKFQISEMLDKWSPAYKLSDIKLSHYPDGRYIFFTCPRIRLSAIPIKPVFFYIFRSFPLFVMIEFWVLANMSNFADLGVSLRRPTFCIIFPTFLLIGISPDFTYIDWVSAGFFPWCIFSLAEEKSLQKMFLQIQSEYPSIYFFKRKCNFCNLDNSFRKITWFV